MSACIIHTWLRDTQRDADTDDGEQEMCEIIQVPDPDGMLPEQRREARILSENLKFDEEHYMYNVA
jgi:hypothetical protein